MLVVNPLMVCVGTAATWPSNLTFGLWLVGLRWLVVAYLM
uniref:Uncharacterized protein n=1 Tax=Arundo donax TaxID=35708 RepID=A0A0A8XT47_ARUDO